MLVTPRALQSCFSCVEFEEFERRQSGNHSQGHGNAIYPSMSRKANIPLKESLLLGKNLATDSFTKAQSYFYDGTRRPRIQRMDA